MMYRQDYRKPDGRALHLYSRQIISPHIIATSPSDTPISSSGAHMRWHPLRGEWVAYAAHRQNRTFLPPKEFNPLAPSENPEYPTELPIGNYDVAVFDNMFPTFTLHPELGPSLSEVATNPAFGACEVVVYTQDSESSLGRLPIDHLCLLIEVWAERTTELGKIDGIQYVLPFENKGVEVGVTLHHPHGQIYAYPFVPPVVANFQQQERHHWEKSGRSLLMNMLDHELLARVRTLYESPFFIAFVPVCARYPYEVWIAPRRQIAFMSEMNDIERKDLATALKTVLLKFDGLWQRSFPYLMLIYQAACDGKSHPEAHFHFEFLPPYRSRDRLKFLAGTELGAGIFANDSLPEEKARELQAVEVEVE